MHALHDSRCKEISITTNMQDLLWLVTGPQTLISKDVIAMYTCMIAIQLDDAKNLGFNKGKG